LMPILASSSFLCVRFAYIIPRPDYCVPPSKTLEQQQKKLPFAGDYRNYPHIYPQVVDKRAQTVRVFFLRGDLRRIAKCIFSVTRHLALLVNRDLQSFSRWLEGSFRIQPPRSGCGPCWTGFLVRIYYPDLLSP
jgi:hypothetical protein